MSAGAFADFTVFSIPSHVLTRSLRSCWSISSVFPSATVRMIAPNPFGSIARTTFRSRRFSLKLAIFLETPTFPSKGMRTRNRPGSEIAERTRTPFFPIGSFVICTSISCPFCRLTCGKFCAEWWRRCWLWRRSLPSVCSLAGGTPFPPPTCATSLEPWGTVSVTASAASSSFSSSSSSKSELYSSIEPISEKCRKASCPMPISTNAARIPGITLATFPR